MTDDKIVFTDNMKIKSNSKGKDYSCLSNHFVSEVNIDGEHYYHVEGFYHSSKFLSNNDTIAKRIRSVIFPQLCKKIADKNPIDDAQLTRWDQGYKIIVMKRGVFTKFITNSDLAKVLLSTKEAKLIYNSTDNYWGNGDDGVGENILGKILEEVRDTIEDLPNIEDE